MKPVKKNKRQLGQTLVKALKDAIAFERGEIKLKTVECEIIPRSKDV
jgi:hypothetical protein